MKLTCDLGCEDPLPIESTEEFEAHLRLYHPDQSIPFTVLPDGTVVVFDEPVEGRDVETEFGGTE